MRAIDEGKLQAIHQYINRHIESEGRAPTIREIASACHTAIATVSRYVDLLEERKLITKTKRGAKSCIGASNTGLKKAYILGACPCGHGKTQSRYEKELPSAAEKHFCQGQCCG